jgi:phosphate transport system permease protein
MSTVTVPPPAPPSAPPPRRLSDVSAGGWRRFKSGLMTVLMGLSVLVALVPLVLIIGYVISRGSEVLSWEFITGDIPTIARADASEGGIGPALVGTLIITGAATLMAIPLGILGGIFLNEYGANTWFGRTVRFFADVMTGVPSIVMGLFIYTVWVLEFGYSGFAGALALACLMLPVVIRTTEEMLRLVPQDLRQSAYALGGRKAGTVVRVVLPAAAPGIISGALLAIARAAGETAPLIFTIFTTERVTTDLFNGPNTALSTQIYQNAAQVFPGPQARAWGAALVLIIIVFVFTILARLISALFSRKHQT